MVTHLLLPILAIEAPPSAIPPQSLLLDVSRVVAASDVALARRVDELVGLA
jgi:hypothetical protein